MFTEFFDADENLKIQLEDLKTEVSRKDETIKILSGENTWLKEQLSELKRNQFGKKSERWESPEQLTFNEAEVEASQPPPPELTEEGATTSAASNEVEVEVKAHTKKKRGFRQPLPTNLPREIVKIELPPEERFAEDGTPLKIIGWQVSEKLKFEPSNTSVVEYQRAMYGVDSGDYVKTAPPVPSIIPKGIGTSELFTAIVIGKYADGLPLYRMEEIFKRQGIDLSRGTMARWVIKLADACLPVWNVLSDRLHEAFYVAVDETKLQVLKEKGRRAEADSWMFVRSTPFGPEKIVLFDYSPSRAGAIAQKLFADYKGYLQCDELSSYDCLESKDVIRIGCNMHGRRGFDKAVVSGAKEGKSLGEMGLKFYGRIYDVEETCKDKTPDERHKIREKHARPIWDEFKSWIDQQKMKVPGKSKIGGAVRYINRHYEHLVAYLKDGRLNIDNGFTERTIRKFAIGRNNWMFSDGEFGANASAIMYSLVVTAKVNGVNPYKALVKLFEELPKAKTIDDYERLADLILKPENPL